MTHGMLSLDPQIRNWVLVPIFLLVLGTSLMRRYILQISQPNPAHAAQMASPFGSKPTFAETQARYHLRRSALLRVNGARFLSREGFEQRKRFLLEPQTGILWSPPAQLNPLQQVTSANSDPTVMFSMMKNQLGSFALSAGLGYVVGSLFSGYFVAKVPFALTKSFKPILQRGIDVPNLDASYVSSLSWYFFIYLSCNGVLQLLSYFLDGPESAGIKINFIEVGS